MSDYKKRVQQDIGYLPDETPSLWRLILYALQHVIVMFPATVAVALITDFHISTTIFASGLATLAFILVTRGKLPLYFGSSFSYVAAIGGLMSSEALAGLPLDEKISIAQFGIIISGLLSIAAGLIVNRFGREAIEKVLPASITGPIAMVIGLTLAGNAMADAVSPAIDAAGSISVPEAMAQQAQNMAIVVSLVTLLATIFFSVHLKGVAGQLPLLLGPLLGVAVAFAIGEITGISLFRVLPEAAGRSIFALPNFTFPTPNGMAVAALAPIALATIPESTAHVYQLDIYVNDLAKKKGSKKRYDISSLLGSNLIGDGVADIVAGLIGGPAGTNYGENISAMAISGVFSVPVIAVAAGLAMVIACFTPLINGLYALPTSVIGGMEIYLFGAIAAQGMAIMIEKKVDMFSAKNIAVIACIMIIGLGGTYAFGGQIPFLFGTTMPAISAAAIFGILLNLLLSIGQPKAAAPEAQITDQED